MRETLGISRDDLSEKGQTQTINEVDRMDENNLLKALKDNDIFSDTENQETGLKNIVTKDLASDEIEDDLLSAKQKGKLLLKTFVEERF